MRQKTEADMADRAGDDLTYEEHVARAMLMGLGYFPAYQAYADVGTMLDDWIDANTLTPINNDIDMRYQQWTNHRMSGSWNGDEGKPTHKRWHKWKVW